MFQVLILLWSVLSLDTLSTLIHLSTVDLSESGPGPGDSRCDGRGTSQGPGPGSGDSRCDGRGTSQGPGLARGTAGAMGAEVVPVSRPARSAGCRATQIYHQLWERTFIYTCWRDVE